ncbi:hypothetical protein SEA_RIKSENGUPTA_47 [Microbacterium phage RikSengupta]|nr:hypothetical protein SEA_TINYMINY_47 [Microbacterium phage TinyMiny]UVF61376.1 hypothetical protein SEA_SPARCETUS_47 [Microbacterium phage Sparcetus]WMI33143.1 hypothetical protein SEA_RIKSENGUPTA_47 [Microbacterium phage RikSengupta]
MKSIQEAGPGEIAAVKRRTIRTLAVGGITDEQCTFINKHLDAVSDMLENLNKEA